MRYAELLRQILVAAEERLGIVPKVQVAVAAVGNGHLSAQPGGAYPAQPPAATGAPGRN
jgi:hypothetical protein